MAEDTSPILCQAIGDDNLRGLTGCNTKCKTSNGKVLENTYEDSIKKKLQKDDPQLTHFGADARLCSSNRLQAGCEKVLCKDCVLDNRAKEVIRDDKALDKYLAKNLNPAEKEMMDKLLTANIKINVQQETKNSL